MTRNQAHFEMKNQWIPSNLATSLSLHLTCGTWILLLCKSVLHLNAIIDNHYSSQANVLLLNGEIAILRTTHDRLNLIFSTRRGGAIIWVTLLGDLIGGTPQTAFRKLKRRFKFPSVSQPVRVNIHVALGNHVMRETLLWKHLRLSMSGRNG